MSHSSFTATWLGLLLIASTGMAHAQPQQFTSAEQQATLLELYTSEGCSSCPPADHWLSQFIQDERLWKRIVPVAFHVDYWDHLGWRDRYSDARYSQRQATYQQQRYVGVVYTPGLMQNGREFRGWNRGRDPVPDKPRKVGVLRATVDKDAGSAEFIPLQQQTTPLTLNIALLGFELTTQATAGENRGKELRHDFVVLDFQQRSAVHNNPLRWQLDDLLRNKPAQATGIALWISAGDDPTPLQATGGWLK